MRRILSFVTWLTMACAIGIPSMGIQECSSGGYPGNVPVNFERDVPADRLSIILQEDKFLGTDELQCGSSVEDGCSVYLDPGVLVTAVSDDTGPIDFEQWEDELHVGPVAKCLKYFPVFCLIKYGRMMS